MAKSQQRTTARTSSTPKEGEKKTKFEDQTSVDHNIETPSEAEPQPPTRDAVNRNVPKTTGEDYSQEGEDVRTAYPDRKLDKEGR